DIHKSIIKDNLKKELKKLGWFRSKASKVSIFLESLANSFHTRNSDFANQLFLQVILSDDEYKQGIQKYIYEFKFSDLFTLFTSSREKRIQERTARISNLKNVFLEEDRNGFIANLEFSSNNIKEIPRQNSTKKFTRPQHRMLEDE